MLLTAWNACHQPQSKVVLHIMQSPFVAVSRPARWETFASTGIANSALACFHYIAQNAMKFYTVSQKNDTDVALCNFNSHQPILEISGRNVAERVHYQMVVSYPTSPN